MTAQPEEKGKEAITIGNLDELPPAVEKGPGSEIVHCHPFTLIRWAREGRVPAKKVGGRWLFPTAELLAMAGVDATSKEG